MPPARLVLGWAVLLGLENHLMCSITTMRSHVFRRACIVTSPSYTSFIYLIDNPHLGSSEVRTQSRLARELTGPQARARHSETLRHYHGGS